MSRIITHRRLTRLATATLLGGASLLSLGATAHAQSVLFSTAADLTSGTNLGTGREVSIASGTVQVRLPGGGLASFVDAAQFSLRDDGSVDLRSGSVTVVGARGATIAVHMPQGVQGSVAGTSAATFTATAAGSRGSTTAGSVAVTSNGVTKSFTAGQFWTAGAGHAPDRVIAGSAAAVPGVRDAGPVRPMLAGGPVAAAENGIPVALGEGLAGVGASGEIVAAARRIEAYDANPTIAAFPTGDYALLVQYAAQANGLLGAGGVAFRGAGADIIRSYFEYLAAGNAGANFRTAYAQVLLNYLDLLRAGVLPSTFKGATQSQLNAYLAFIGRTDGFGTLSAANQQLLSAYIAFLGTGGAPDAFGVSVTNLTTSFLNYVRGGGNPASFTQASASVVAQYLAIVNSGGLRTNLTAQNQALLTAYLANNGIGFTTTYATGLAAFVAYLNTGGLPSGYTALPQATIRPYLETLETTGLFDSVLGAQSAFLRSYLVFLRGGGTADQFNALPINIARVNAANLNLYVDYLLAGGAPTAYTALTQAQIRAALDQLTATGQFNALLGINAAFLSEYYAYIRTGADADSFAGLPSVDVNAYAASLQLFAAYLRAGSLPSGYTALTAQQIRSYLTALQVAGKLSLLGDNATLLGDYLTYIRTGGAPDAFTGLPIVTYQGYATALTAYFAYLNAGGLPSGYTVLTQAQLRTYLDVLKANGQFALLGANATFYTNYLAYLASGGAVDTFGGLPIVTYQGYATALTAYFAYLNGGGLPSGYTVLTQAQIRAYLDALSANAQLTALLGSNAAFFTQYRAYLLTGASVDAFVGLPIVTYQSYAVALNAYYAFLVGGGTPSAYTALTQAQIRTYLDALKAAGQVTALLGANSAFFTQYLAFLETGGSANNYPGLPSSTYGQYATALNLYFAYLNGGGLPSGYTALTQAQIREYLSVLQANNQLAALLGANATFFANYLTFVSGGGAPDAFTGLPIVTYQGYASALTAYYAYLAGGGLPAGYTVLTQAQIRAYLDALSAANQITALLGANAAFFTSYYAYLASGGAPDGFSGLPAATYANYGSALQAFVAYLRGNGLPGSYGALTSAQLREYLAVLQANGQLGLIGSAADQQLLTAYAAYLASGGVPNQYAGLPAFVTYEAALRTYYAFLQGGGRPSAYTALSQAQIVAYIQALDAAGLVTTKLTADEAKFLRDYAAYVSAGNNADQFAALPINQTPTAPTVAQGLANAPASASGGVALAYAGKGLPVSGTANGNVSISSGTLAAFSGGTSGATRQTATMAEARTVDQTIALARLSGGTYNTQSTVTANQNEGAHIVWGTPATAVAASGTVNFGLVTATAPTVEGGATAPGSFTGNLAVNLGTRMAGFDSVIGIGGVTYRFASAGGTSAPSLQMTQQFNFSGASSTASNGLAGTVSGFLSGTGGAYGGLSYSATAPIGAVTGVAIFGKNQPLATLPAVTYTGAPTVTPDLPAPSYGYTAGLAATNLYVRSVFPSTLGTTTAPGLSFQTSTSVTRDANGGLQRTNAGTQVQDITRGTAKVTDIYGDSRAVIGRWYDGTYTRQTTSSQSDTITLSASQSLHYLQLAPVNFITPTSGQVNYTLLAATQPTYTTGATGAGLFDGRMALAFGSSVKVALEGTIRMPESSGTVTYAFATPGGVAGVAALTGQTFSNNVIAVTAPITGSGLACTTACQLNFSGGFAGTDVNRIGAVYFTSDSRGNAGPSIQGAAIFNGTPATGTTTANLAAPNYAYAAGLPSSGLTVRATIPGAQPSAQIFLGGAAVTRDSTGALVTASNASTADMTRLTAKATDTFGDNRAAIGRWYDGDYRLGPSNNAAVTLSGAQNVHYLQLAPATFTMPTTGTVNYTLLAATQPTYNSGTLGAGLFDAKAALAFGSGIKFAIEGTIKMPEASGTVTYAFATPGGVAGVASQFAQTPSSYSIATTAPMTGTGIACTSGCQINFNATFAGADVNRLGLIYNTNNTAANSSTVPSIQGAAIFTGAAAPAGNVVATPTQPVYSYAGGFGSSAIVRGGTETDSAGGNSVGSLINGGSNSIPVTVSSTGGVSSFSGGAIGTNTIGTARQSDVAGDASILLGRWTGGSQTILSTQRTYGAYDSTHYLLLAPGTVTLPTSGIVNYSLIGATQPTLFGIDTTTGAGVFDAKLAVAFGAPAKIGIEGAIYMPETSAGAGNSVKYTFATDGGIAAPSKTGVNASSISFNAPLTGPGVACPSGSCLIFFDGGFGGGNTNRIGLDYTTKNEVNGAQIFGAAAFAAAGTTGTGGTGGGDGSTFSGTATGQLTYAYSGSSLVDFGSGNVVYQQGKIASYTSVLTGKTVTNGVIQESGRLSDVIGWARWTGDTAGPSTNQGPNAGVHVMSGTPTVMTTLPTGGTAQYTLTGSTKPTLAAPGSVTGAPGTITGSLAVAYGTTPRVGFDLTMTAGDYGWRVTTTGGVANPGQSQATVGSNGSFSAAFNKSGGTVTATTAASCLSGCGVNVGGQFYGTGGSHIGVAFNATDTSSAGSALASGLAIFAKAP